MDLSGIFIYLVLKNPSTSLDSFNAVKVKHIHESYLDVFSSISTYYEKHTELPTFEHLNISVRSDKILAKLASISKLDVDDALELEVVTEALTDEHVQNEALIKIETLVKNITLLDSMEIITEINNISMELEEDSVKTGTVNTMADMLVAQEAEISLEQTYLGINDIIDKDIKVMSTELVLLGGERGSGKSIVVNNIGVNQYEAGNIGLIFSIEMRRSEIFNRSLSMLSGVSNMNIRNGTLSENEYTKLAITRANMFKNSSDILDEFMNKRDFRSFELNLVKNHKLTDNQIIIVDDQKLTLSSIDAIITKQKAKFGSLLKTAVVDYVNQIHMDQDQYDWKSQITLSKRLKDIARKHDISIISPYQIDKSGEARFSKGLLDAADLAFNLTANDDSIAFETTKIRSGPDFTVASNIDWDILRINPVNITEVTSDFNNTNVNKAKETQDL